MILRAGTRFVEPTRLGRLFSSCHGKKFPSTHEMLNPQSKDPEFREVIDEVRGAAVTKHEQRVKNEQREGRRNASSGLEKQNRAETFEKYQLREWKVGDVYAPHDLSQDVFKHNKRPVLRKDAFDTLGINPLHEYKNFSIIWEYTSQMGRIRHRDQTKLRGVNQRRISKAIRRATGMGLMPSVHNHPEILEHQKIVLAARRQREEQEMLLGTRGQRDASPSRR